MSDVYPELEPYDRGMLGVGDGHRVYWETSGNPRGTPALAFHGGPGSGSAPWFRRLFDPSAYRIVLFDQRGSGRSTPNASNTLDALDANTTAHLVADTELLRVHLRVERWLILGGSWGSTLALAYAEAHPARAAVVVLFGVTTGRHSEFDWTFRGGLGQFFPMQWDALVNAAGPLVIGESVVDAYARLLRDPKTQARAAEAWCRWESATLEWPPRDELAERFRDHEYRLGFARIVTHYVRHNAWLEDGVLLRHADRLAQTPSVLVNGRFDLQAPLGNAWALRRAWPSADLVIVDDAGHAVDKKIARELVRATDRFRPTG